MAAQKALSCVYRTGQRFGAAHLIDVLRGSDSERIRQFGHDRVSTHGIGTELDARAWRGVFRQLVAAGLLEVDSEGYGGLRLTEASRPVLQGKREVQLRKEPPRARNRRGGDGGGSRPAADVAPADLPLFDALRALRTTLAREQGVPPYVIFHDATLREIARLRPRTPGELLEVGGIGAGKAERYGDAVLDVVAGASDCVRLDGVVGREGFEPSTCGLSPRRGH